MAKKDDEKATSNRTAHWPYEIRGEAQPELFKRKVGRPDERFVSWNRAQSSMNFSNFKKNKRRDVLTNRIASQDQKFYSDLVKINWGQGICCR